MMRHGGVEAIELATRAAPVVLRHVGFGRGKQRVAGAVIRAQKIENRIDDRSP